MATPRSPFFDTALHVLKGAVASALQLPTGRTTSSVKQVAACSGRIVLNSVDSFSDEQRSVICSLVDQKVREDAPFRVWRMLRADADRLYGDTMYDSFKVPDSVTELRLVSLERWNLNANINQVLRSTGQLKKLEITKTKHNAKKKELEINFECFPETSDNPPLAETLEHLDPYPPLAETVPDILSPAKVSSASVQAASPSVKPGAAPKAGGPEAGEGAAKEKKARPAPPPPPPPLATASLLVRAAAARVLGLRPGTSGGEMQPLWVTEPGNAKVSLSLEGCARSPFPKDELHGALIEAIEVATNELVHANLAISVFTLDKATAEADYGSAMYDAKSTKGEVLHLAYVPGAILAEVPSNWSLCETTATCGKVSFQVSVEAGSKKKPDTLILAKKKQMSVRYSVEHPDAAGVDGRAGDRPSSDAVKEIDDAVVRISVAGVDSEAAGTTSDGAAKEVTPSLSAKPRYPYPRKGTSAQDPAMVYWTWFARALATRLRDAAAAAGCKEEDLLRDPTAAGVQRACAEAKHPLSEAELAHLALAPVSSSWLKAALEGGELPCSDEGKAEAEPEMVVNAMEVSGKIDYNKLVKDFGSTIISEELLARVERLTVGRGRVSTLHPWLRRAIFYSHRDLDRICTCVEQGKPFYLYTGRGPSSLAMHLGHLIPFMMTKWLQDAFNVPLVIQLTEDEKFLWKGKWDPEKGDDLMKFRHFTHENVKDIIAVGFDKKKTFIFSDLEYVGHMYPNIVRIWKGITYNTARACFGFQGDNNIGQSAFCAIQAAPSFPTSFQIPLGGQDNMCCLIPCAIDQDPYFRLTREVAHKLVPETHPLQGKPALLHAKFFPPLQGALGKMSASDTSSAVFLTDSPEEITSKIHKYAFSGGRATAKEQREKGADLDVDVPYQWLRFFLDDDAELEKIAREYGSGSGDFWNTGSVKDRLVKELQRIVEEHQSRRKNITDEEVAEWMSVRKLEF